MKQKNVILMVVAVGCGLVAAVLTSQMSAKPAEQVEVIVAAKDLTVGTVLSRDDLKEGGSLKLAKRPKEGLPPTVLFNPEDLNGKGLARPIRADEPLTSQDLRAGGVVPIPDGYHMFSVQVNAAQSAAGFVGPGSRVNVQATVRLGTKLESFPLLVNMLVIAVDTHIAYDKGSNGTFPTMNMVSFAVKDKEALLLDLARARGCNISLMLRNRNATSDADATYKIDDVIKKLSDDRETSKVSGVIEGEPRKSDEQPSKTQPEAKKEEPKTTTPSVPMVKVFVAKKDIPANTQLTRDLVAQDFEEKQLPADIAGKGMSDLTDGFDKFLRNGVAEGQWLTPGMLGLQESKTAPPEWFSIPKGTQADPIKEPATPQPTPTAKRTFHDVTVVTPGGTMVIRYEWVNGKWKKMGELTPEQAARDPNDDGKKDAPKIRD